MKYRIELKAPGKKEQKSGNLPLEEILKTGDRMIEKAVKESE